MKKIFSLITGLTLVIGNSTIGGLFSEQIQPIVALCCVLLGASLLAYLLKIFEKEKENSKILFEQLVSLFKEIDKKLSNVPDRTQFEEQIKSITNDVNNVEKTIRINCETNHTELKTMQEILTTAIKANFSDNVKVVCDAINDMKQNAIVLNEEIIKNSNANNDSLILQVKEIGNKNINVLQEQKDSYNENLNKTKLELSNIQKTVDEHKTIVQNIHSNLSKLNDIPKNVYMVVDDLIGKLDEFASSNKKMIEQLCENISDNNQSLTTKITRSLDEIVDSVEDYNSNIAERITELAQQYIDFKQYGNELIEKMTLMSKGDYEMLRGLLDGNKTK